MSCNSALRQFRQQELCLNFFYEVFICLKNYMAKAINSTTIEEKKRQALRKNALRRERTKEMLKDPVQHAIYLAKERQKYRKRKQNGKILLIHDLEEKKQEERRRNNKAAVKRYRAKKIPSLTNNSFTILSEISASKYNRICDNTINTAKKKIANILDRMNEPGEVEDMIEIESIKQEPQIKEEIDFPDNQEFNYPSGEKSTNNNLELNELKTISTQLVPLSVEDDSQNTNGENFILTQNPFCDIQIANISYNRNAEVLELNDLKVEESIPENPIDEILFECEKCCRPSKQLKDHNYAKVLNRLKEAIENEERKKGSQTYSCKFCQYVRMNPQKYLIHMQRHESKTSPCRTCHESFTVSDFLKVHMLIKFRTCEFCRKVFTQEKGYRKHLKLHFPVQKKNEHIGRFEEITIEEESHEIDLEAERATQNKEILPIIIESNESDTEESDTVVENGESQVEEQDIEGDAEKPDTYQKSFSQYLKNWNNPSTETAIPKKETWKRNNETVIKECPLKKRKEFPTSVSSPEEVEEIYAITPPENLEPPVSVEKLIPCNKIEKEIFLFECARCARNFVSRSAILEHLTNKHNDEFRFWETLYTKKKLEHKKSDVNTFINASTCSDNLKISHACSNCDKTFSSKNFLKIHKCELVCRLCQKRFLYRSHYIMHLKTHANDCEICKKQFASALFLTTHLKSAHPEGFCHSCKRWFPSEYLLKKHKMIVHNHSLRTFYCLICEKNIDSEYEFRIHMESHGSKRPFSCPHCCRSYATYLGMTAHSESCEEFDETNVYECDICKKAFYNKEKFIPHMKMHMMNRMVEDAKARIEKAALNNLEDPKSSETTETKKTLPTPSSNKNLKSLHFGPKIVWRESSIRKSSNIKLRKRCEEPDKKIQIRRFDLKPNVERMAIQQSEKKIFVVAKEKPAATSCDKESVQKLLILRPITRVTKKRGFESVNEKVKLDAGFQPNVLKSHSTFNLLPVTVDVDPLNLEYPVIDTASEIINLTPVHESDPLAMENSTFDNDESDPLALENPPLDSIVDLEMISDSEIEESEKSSTTTNEYVSKFRYFSRKESNMVIIEEDKSKVDLLHKKADPKQFFCTICKRQILLRLKIEHMKMHDEGIKMFECSICEKKFTNRSSKRRHEFTHKKNLTSS